jgi:hypothetical protein
MKDSASHVPGRQFHTGATDVGSGGAKIASRDTL